MKKLKKIWCFVNILRGLPAIISYNLSNNKEIINKDIDRWVNICNLSYLRFPSWLYLNWLLLYYPQFRNLFYHRLKKWNHLISLIIQIFYKPLDSLYIYTENIGAGLYIQHGFSTIITAKSIGENCWINQQVTIGHTKAGCPIIGNNVTITAGAIVVGDIKIGDNSVIGANAIVNKDVPANCTVVGNPAFIVKRNGVKTKEYLNM